MEIKDYTNKNILAPMVRAGHLTFRLLALELGADIVYTEEIIDFKILDAKRRINEKTSFIEYIVEKNRRPVFQTCEAEKGKIVFQLATCDAQRALQACKIVEEDVSAIDINMGCPKEFSVHGGMGCALLKKPDLIQEILKTLVNGCRKPITCKIRCLPSLESTIELCKKIEKCGVKAIGVHGRFQHERSKWPNHDDYIKAIAKQLSIPVIANGGSNLIKCYEDIEKFKQSCGVSSAMVARAAMWNCSVFRKEGVLPMEQVIKRYLRLSLETENFFYNAKYVVQQMLHEELTGERGLALLASQSDDEIYKLFDMLDEYNEKKKRDDEYYNSKEASAKKRQESSGAGEEEPEEGGEEKRECSKKMRLDLFDEKFEGKKVICKFAKYNKKDYKSGSDSPKSVLHTYTMESDISQPVYHTFEKKPERVYKSWVEVENVFFTTPNWDVSKQRTEQSAAMVCLETRGINYKNSF